MTTLRRWAAGRVETGHEPDVEHSLQDQGCVVYLPRTLADTRRKREIVPAYPGYLLLDIHTVANARLADERRFYGFVTFGGCIPLLKDEDVARIREWEALGAHMPDDTAIPMFLVGELVKVPGGPFGGLTGRVVMSRPGRVWLDGYDFTTVVSFPDLTLIADCA